MSDVYQDGRDQEKTEKIGLSDMKELSKLKQRLMRYRYGKRSDFQNGEEIFNDQEDGDYFSSDTSSESGETNSMEQLD
jgi:hypothetical protein